MVSPDSGRRLSFHPWVWPSRAGRAGCGSTAAVASEPASSFATVKSEAVGGRDAAAIGLESVRGIGTSAALQSQHRGAHGSSSGMDGAGDICLDDE